MRRSSFGDPAFTTRVEGPNTSSLKAGFFKNVAASVLKTAGVARQGPFASGTTRQGLHARRAVFARDALAVRFADSRMEHDARRRDAHFLGKGLFEGRGIGPFRDHDQARVDAKLAHAHGERTLQAGGHFVPATGGHRARQKKDRIDAAHLGIDRDRLGPGRSQVEERASALPRTGESDRLDVRMLHERLADHAARSVKERVRSLRQTAFGRRAQDGVADDFRGARMGVVRLDDDRIARRQRRDDIAARRRKRQREIARAENHHRADAA